MRATVKAKICVRGQSATREEHIIAELERLIQAVKSWNAETKNKLDINGNTTWVEVSV